MQSLKNKKVFVTGGAGCIGKELVNLLLEEGAILFIGDLKPCPEEWKDNKNITYREGDLNYIKAERLLDFGPDYVFHLAAKFQRSEETQEFWEENWWHNIILSHHMIDILKDCSFMKKYIFASSYLVYNPRLYMTNYTPIGDESKYLDLEECYSKNPRNLCGYAKYVHEGELQYLSKMYNINYNIARIYRGYGKGSDCVISRWIRDILRNKTITTYGVSNYFDFIYSSETAKCLLLLAKSKAENEICNVGNGRARSIKEVISILHNNFSEKIKLVEKPVKKEYLYEYSQANIIKFKNLTNYTPQLQLENAIPKIIEFERDRL